MKIQKGFTLIELLVVIAIIGILAGILFAAINPKKQTDSAKESNILGGFAQMPTWIVDHNVSDFSDTCVDGIKSKKILDAIATQAGDNSPICHANKVSYGMSVKFNNNGTVEKYCLDITGVHKGVEADTDLGLNNEFDCVSGN